MNRKLILTGLIVTLFISLRGQSVSHSFTFSKHNFLLDGKPFQIISGEMHPARIPEAYWRNRIRMAKAMGCNTIAAYIFWNYQEPKKGVFNFTEGNHNIARFIRIAQEEGMWVLLRPGPYVCAEWDFGGLPPYLLKIPDIKVRCMDPSYTRAVKRYIANLALQVKDLQASHGGPILMVQIENEYGSYGNDQNYIHWLADLWRQNGIDVPFYTADGAAPYMLEAGSLEGAAIGLDPAAGEAAFAEATKMNPDVPSFCSELYPGWLTHWGEKWARTDTTQLLKNVRWLMDHQKSFNFYVINGGTNFGFYAGANATGSGEYQPDVTSYDYDAPINEMGHPTDKYFALRRLIAGYLPKGKKLPPVPKTPPVIEISNLQPRHMASLWDNLPEPKKSAQPRPMEMYGQNYGYILYRTKLVGHKSGTLHITSLHDYATVFIDGHYVGTLDRSKGENSIKLPETDSRFPQLDILVEGMGRINYGQYLIDRKGITDRVTLNGITLMNWDVYNLPMDTTYIHHLHFSDNSQNQPGIFFRGTFTLKKIGDTYLDMSKWKKGVVWVNGHNLGRYWNRGPQTRLFCPGAWLKKGENSIILFDMHALKPETINGVGKLQ